MTSSRWVVPLHLLAACVAGASVTASAQDTTRTEEPLARLDFRNADLRAVMSAVAETGGLQVTFGEFPRRRISLHLPQALPRADMLPLLMRLGAANGLRVVRNGTAIRIGNAGESDGAPAERGSTSPRDAAMMFVYKLKHARAPYLAATLQSMNAPRYRIVADVPANALLIQASPTDYSAIRATIDSLDVRPLQVVVEVELVEVRRRTAGGGPPGGLPLAASDFIVRFTRGGAIARDSALSILARGGEVRIFPQPLIMTENNVPVHVSEFSGKDAVLDLSATILRDGLVNLAVTQKVHLADDPARVGAAGPHETTGHLQLRDGETGVMGGLAEGWLAHTSSGIPVLRSIPFYGQLFGSTSVRGVQSDRYIFFTPHIVATVADSVRWRDRLNNTGLSHTTVTP